MEHAVECLNSFGAAHLGNGARPQLIAQGGAGGGVGMDCHNTSPFRGANRSPRAPFVNQSRLWPPNP